MIHDEIDGAGPAKAVPLTRSRYIWMQRWVTVALFLGLILLKVVAEEVFAVKLWRGLGTWSLAAAIALAKLAVDQYLERRGIGRGGPTVQVWAQAGVVSAEGDAAVEIRTPRELLLVFGVICMVVAIAAGALGCGLAIKAFGRPAGGDWSDRLGRPLALTLGSVGVGVLGSWCLRQARSPRRHYRADAAGFTDFKSEQFFPWSAIASYRVTTHHDPVGDPTEAMHELIGWHGDPLVTFHLEFLPAADRARLLRFLQARLPQPIKAEALAEL